MKGFHSRSWWEVTDHQFRSRSR